MLMQDQANPTVSVSSINAFKIMTLIQIVLHGALQKLKGILSKAH